MHKLPTALLKTCGQEGVLRWEEGLEGLSDVRYVSYGSYGICFQAQMTHMGVKVDVAVKVTNQSHYNSVTSYS